MRAFIWIFGVLLAWFVADRVMGLLLDRVTEGSSFRFTRLYKDKVDAEILILGNSRGVNSFYQPDMQRRSDKKVFNLSYNGLRIDIARVLLEDYLARNRKPELLILEASMLTKSFPELVKEFKPYMNGENSISIKMKELYPDTYRGCIFSHLYRYNSELYLRSLYYMNREDQEWINDGDISAELISLLAGYGGTQFQVDSTLLTDLRAVEEICVKNDITLRVVLTPYLPAYRSKIRNIDEWLATVNSTLTHTQVMDMSTMIIDEKYFADWVHLNKEGSGVYLDTLITRKMLW